MKVKLSVCAAAALLGVTAIASQDRAALIDPALAQPGRPTPTYDVYMCSAYTKGQIFVATVGIEGNKLRAKGWVTLDTKPDCQKNENYTKIGTFGRPSFWWYATDGQGIWGSKDANKSQICVNLNDNFDYTWDGKGRECNSGEQLVDFNETKVPDNQRTYGTWFRD